MKHDLKIFTDDIEDTARKQINLLLEQEALLVRVKNDNSLLFVVCHILEKNSWCGGTYFDNLSESMKYYRGI